MSMADDLHAIGARVAEAMHTLETEEALEQLRVSMLGRKGELTGLMRQMGQLSPEERPEM